MSETPEIPKEIQEWIKNNAKEFCRLPESPPDITISSREYSLQGLLSWHNGAEAMYRHLASKEYNPWIKASIRLPPAPEGERPTQLPIKWRGIMFIGAWGGSSFNGDHCGCLSTPEHFEEVEWLEISQKPVSERADNEVSKYLNFKSASHQDERDYFTIRMDDGDGKNFVTEFNGKFGRLLFDKELVRKAVGCRKVLEVLLEGYSDTWPGYMTDKVTAAIDNAKNFIESPSPSSEIESLRAERDEYRKALEEIVNDSGGKLCREDRSRMYRIAETVLAKYPSGDKR